MPSFDIVSKVQQHEVDNAFNQAQKEIAQRFDFKDTDTSLERAPASTSAHSGDGVALFPRRAFRRRAVHFVFTSIAPKAVRPKRSGRYMSSAVAGG